ncbi:MAG: imelysin family protein [Myxococcota bacterium]|nr:imelysin family protein [Myxococcota bacterium]
MHLLPRSLRSVPAVLAVLVTAGCVIVSSTSHTPPVAEEDASTTPRDAGPRPDGSSLRDAGGLTRAEATSGMLASIGARVVLPTYRTLATEAAALEDATRAYGESGSADDLAAAREAWRRTIAVAQRAELMQFGPAGMQTSDVLGGLGLRDAIYSWPAFNRCRIDVVTQTGGYEDLDAPATQGLFMRGLGAIEYLLFHAGADHGCLPGASITVDDAAWSALGETAIRERRADHAHALAQRVSSAAGELLTAWDPSGGDFAGQLARAGQSGSVYASTQSALNAIFSAMYYLDRQIKDDKLEALTGACATAGCPELLESRFAHRSSEHFLENLRGFQMLYLGGVPSELDAMGFDDLLLTVGAAELEADLRVAIEAAIAVAEALPSVDPTNLAEHVDAYASMHAAVERIDDLFKVELKTALALELPMGAPEDND